jgi:diguanylate cyclase
LKFFENYWRRLSQIRPEQAMLVFQSTLAALAITPFGFWRLNNGELGQGLFDLTLVIVLLGLAYLCLQEKLLRLISFVVASIYVLSSLLVAYKFGPLGHYWFFPAIVAGFFVVRASEALGLAALGFLAHVLLASRQGWGIELGTFAATSLLVCIFINAFTTRLRQDNHRLYLDSTIDSLTGAGNRRLFDDVLAELPEDANHETMSLLMLDVDHFKVINDHYGHAIGDRCLNRLAQLIISNLQPSQRLFRYGGEEFVLLVSGSAAEAQALAERLRSEVEHTQLIREAMITVSIGIATKYSQEKLRAWMRRADDAMYEAKQQGRNRCCVAT